MHPITAKLTPLQRALLHRIAAYEDLELGDFPPEGDYEATVDLHAVGSITIGKAKPVNRLKASTDLYALLGVIVSQYAMATGADSRSVLLILRKGLTEHPDSEKVGETFKALLNQIDEAEHGRVTTVSKPSSKLKEVR